MTVKAYIYAEDGALLGYMAYADVPPEVLELGGRYFQKKGVSRQVEEDTDEDIRAFDYWVIGDEIFEHDVIEICTGGCGRNASLTWWKCCPDHVTLDGPDVICQSCVEHLHPGEEEFARK